ncbi:hypothetical protein B0H17DRAFT_1127762 [Mycena rosella]|uniref:Uncharacterized protein n=1 Tax=Mycena rosella TaxID=1033263 RepID=A0AAD7DZD7_MYCRO|nr:hypothetical protein B0H17DRAFT_1127762 [Mycena rosella]
MRLRFWFCFSSCVDDDIFGAGNWGIFALGLDQLPVGEKTCRQYAQAKSAGASSTRRHRTRDVQFLSVLGIEPVPLLNACHGEAAIVDRCWSLRRGTWGNNLNQFNNGSGPRAWGTQFRVGESTRINVAPPEEELGRIDPELIPELIPPEAAVPP